MHFTLDGDRFELTPELVRSRLEGHIAENIRDYWVEIDGARWPVKQVISLATGVRDRQRFQSQSSRRWLEKLGFVIGSGTSPRGAPVAAAATTPPPGRRRPAAQSDVVLVGCVKSKLDHGAPARDLYISDYFAKMRAYAEASRRPWFILSAEHGLVAPDQWLEPYEKYLPKTSSEYQRSWGRRVVDQLEDALGSLDGRTIEVHAGAAYVDAIDARLRARGAKVSDPLHGLKMGPRLSWYLHENSTPAEDDGNVIAQLRNPANGRSLSDVLATEGDGLRSPGMYSWWVDEIGAADLTTGLGHGVDAGLIYAGLAGATRSGGSTSSNTLWGRIKTMHLGRKHQFSTLRLSLGSVLAEAYGQAGIDEDQLTRWMHAHLRLVTVPGMDADGLDALESTILTELDPPLNLAKVPRTPLREELSRLRKRHGS